jgi:hypothetical protein
MISNGIRYYLSNNSLLYWSLSRIAGVRIKVVAELMKLAFGC